MTTFIVFKATNRVTGQVYVDTAVVEEGEGLAEWIALPEGERIRRQEASGLNKARRADAVKALAVKEPRSARRHRHSGGGR